jgi:hypothetical protein
MNESHPDNPLSKTTAGFRGVRDASADSGSYRRKLPAFLCGNVHVLRLTAWMSTIEGQHLGDRCDVGLRKRKSGTEVPILSVANVRSKSAGHQERISAMKPGTLRRYRSKKRFGNQRRHRQVNGEWIFNRVIEPSVAGQNHIWSPLKCGRQESFEGIFRQDIVSIQEQQPFTSGVGCAHIASDRFALVRLPDHVHWPTIRLRDFRGIIGRPVVNHDYL